ncbi:DUF805 domain-containing protein [uncultured Roseibium sp.]|uniref:DUF805 domain-containing protein n=1 Tax=uncultured Roseibium sp. TaxID=1936171 RepID=UPI00261457ED|nr:DUF805 domain-containing protein [uncultured Roseibium sp.]
MALLFGTAGKIGRGRFWIGFLTLVAAGFLVSLLVTAMVLVLGGIGQWIGLGLLLLLLYPAIVLSLKRLRDRGRANPGVWLFAYFAPGVLVNFAQAAGIGFVQEDIGGLIVSSPTALGGSLVFLGFLAFVIAVVDLGFLKGKDLPA